jgi:hypothetical protein
MHFGLKMFMWAIHYIIARSKTKAIMHSNVNNYDNQITKILTIPVTAVHFPYTSFCAINAFMALAKLQEA